MLMKKCCGLLLMGTLFVALGAGALLSAPHAYAQGSGPANVNVPQQAEQIRDKLQQAMREYRLGNYDAAYKLSRGAYLDHFENIEIPLRAMNPDLTAEMEFRFAALRGAWRRAAHRGSRDAGAQRARRRG